MHVVCKYEYAYEYECAYVCMYVEILYIYMYG